VERATTWRAPRISPVLAVLGAMAIRLIAQHEAAQSSTRFGAAPGADVEWPNFQKLADHGYSCTCPQLVSLEVFLSKNFHFLSKSPSGTKPLPLHLNLQLL
jgi:hypothetical protein